ncbi:MAG: sigma 54-interacting transcriptional regulator, partial [Promethearchaeota archaeon]
GDIDAGIQVKILNFLDNKTIQVVGDEDDIQLDIQIIVATNRDLKKLVDQGSFRSDLYYRIKNFQIEIPPLRSRRHDIKDILFFYLRQAGHENIDEIINSDAQEVLAEYDWPGNVRELKNTIDSMLLKMRIKGKKRVDPECLPDELLHSGNETEKKVDKKFVYRDLDSNLAKTELSAIEEALKKTYGQKRAAAVLLGMNADQMRYRVLKWVGKYKTLLDKYPYLRKYYKK